jgi:putative two-component system response regulator
MNDDLLSRSLAARILVVDDIEANVLLLQNLLRQQGYGNVHGTTDPTRVAALHDSDPFELILLDLQMPGCDGFEVMRQLTRDLKGDFLPVIVVTAFTDTENRIKALGQGARDYITKPFLVAEVVHRIRNYLEVRMLYLERQRQAEILEQKVRERTRELSETQKEILRRLALAGEYRDNETGNHVARVSHTCKALALAAGFSDDMAEMIFHASPMHDIGKIGVPDHILLKPGRLELDEMTIMRQHAQIGGTMLGGHPAAILQLAHSIALHHHEKWDGSGYPDALAGAAIPEEVRIVTICDVFDALTSSRPYKKAWPIETAINHLRDEAGRHFDPRLVDIFISILPAILEIRDRFADRTPERFAAAQRRISVAG